MYFIYIMNIIPETECDLISMYCKKDKESEDVEQISDVNTTYILTTKTLITLKDQKVKHIPEVPEELKIKIIREFFNMPYIKDIEDNKIRDEDYNFKFTSFNIKDKDQIDESVERLHQYVSNSKNAPAFLICIQDIPKNNYEETMELFKKDGLFPIANKDEDNISSVMILYKDSSKLEFDLDIFSKVFIIEENIEILSQCFKVSQSKKESIITVININTVKNIMNTLAPNIKSVSFKKVLKKLLIDLIRKNKYDNDIDILLYDLIVCGNFSNTNFKQIVEDIFNEIIGNNPFSIKIIIDSEKHDIQSKDSMENIKFICDFVNNPTCILNTSNNSNVMKPKKTLQNHLNVLGIKNYFKNIGTMGIFISENFKIIDTAIKKQGDEKKISLFEFKGIIDLKEISAEHYTNFFLDFKDGATFMKNNRILIKDNLRKQIDIKYGNDNISDYLNNNIGKEISERERRFKELEENEISFYKITKHELELMSSPKSSDITSILQKMGYSDTHHTNLFDIYLKSDILTLDLFSNHYLLVLQYYYFKEYGYIDINFYDNFKYIINVADKKIKIIMLNNLVYKINFEYDEFRSYILNLLDFLLEESSNNIKIASLLQYTFYTLCLLRIDEDVDIKVEFNFKNVYEKYYEEYLEDTSNSGDDKIKQLIEKLEFKDKDKLPVLLNELDDIKHYKEDYNISIPCEKQITNYAYTSITINFKDRINNSEQPGYCVLKSELLNSKLRDDNLKIEQLSKELFTIDKSHSLYKTVLVMYSKIVKNATYNLLQLRKLLKKYLENKGDVLRNTISEIIKILKNFYPIIPVDLKDLADNFEKDDKLFKLLPEFNKKILCSIIEILITPDELKTFIDKIKASLGDIFTKNMDETLILKVFICIGESNKHIVNYKEPCISIEDERFSKSRTTFYVKLEGYYHQISNRKKAFMLDCKTDICDILKKTISEQIEKGDIKVKVIKGSIILEVTIKWPLDDVFVALQDKLRKLKPDIEIGDKKLVDIQLHNKFEDTNLEKIIGIMKSPLTYEGTTPTEPQTITANNGKSFKYNTTKNSFINLNECLNCPPAPAPVDSSNFNYSSSKTYKDPITSDTYRFNKELKKLRAI